MNRDTHINDQRNSFVHLRENGENEILYGKNLSLLLETKMAT